MIIFIMYTIDGLKHGIAQAKKHIKVLRAAIKDEQQTIADYKIMIADINRAAQAKEEADANVTVEVIRGVQE